MVWKQKAVGRLHLQKNTLQKRAAALILLFLFTVPQAACAVLCLQNAPAVTAGSVVELDVTLSQPPLIAITFDDGPSSVTTPVLLDGLAQRGIHATFFLVGSMAADNHDLVRRMADEGHQIGVHTYDHSVSNGLTGLSDAQFRAQVDTTQDLLSALTGQTDFALRPPYGFVDESVQSRAQGPIILWSIDPEDWRDRDTQRIVEHIIANAEDGAIILLHDIFSSSVEAALEVIDALMAQGYRFVTVDELFAARGVQPIDGEVYCQLPPQADGTN